MQPLQATDQSMQGTPILRNDSPSATGKRLSDPDQFASRWEPGVLVPHITDTDPYVAWLDEHQAERYSATRSTARRATGCLRRNQPPKAPWMAIPVTLSPDRR
jgi:hypothetical protein